MAAVATSCAPPARRAAFLAVCILSQTEGMGKGLTAAGGCVTLHPNHEKSNTVSLEKTMSQFLEKIAEVLEVPSVTPDFAFRSASGWSSLMGFALIVLLDQQYHVTLMVEDFMKLQTVADLARAAGVDA